MLWLLFPVQVLDQSCASRETKMCVPGSLVPQPLRHRSGTGCRELLRLLAEVGGGVLECARWTRSRESVVEVVHYAAVPDCREKWARKLLLRTPPLSLRRPSRKKTLRHESSQALGSSTLG